MIVLTGLMGAGKTTVGEALAAALAVPFADTDAVIVARTGRSIPEIFASAGESAFRAHERGIVADCLRGRTGVLALGGGAVLDQGTRALLLDHSVILLSVSPTEAETRLGAATGRPLLRTDRRTTLTALLNQRRPLYLATASLVVETGGRGPADIVAEIVERFGHG